MTKRVCTKAGCPTLVPATAYRGLCDDHRRERDQQRGTRAERGYGADHQAERARWQQRIDSGHVVQCWRCGARIVGTRWHLDHTDDRTAHRGPACISCNLTLAGKAAHQSK